MNLNLYMVRDFASSVEQMKQLWSTPSTIGRVGKLLRVNDVQELQPSPVSRSFIHLPRPVLGARSNTNLAASSALNRHQPNTAFATTAAKYRFSWGCTELLIDLVGRAPNPTTSPSPSSASPHPQLPPQPRAGRVEDGKSPSLVTSGRLSPPIRLQRALRVACVNRAARPELAPAAPSAGESKQPAPVGHDVVWASITRAAVVTESLHACQCMSHQVRNHHSLVGVAVVGFRVWGNVSSWTSHLRV
ncbi:hypothetical protein BV20DRAFT_982662 [Pilatotrama ljubarskyi]|nr:hypothetical protein BV20DRAFT_982662 [Pilatotrama ljubarskyi]